MSNDFESNFTRKLMEKVLVPFENQRVISKNVNTQFFQGKYNPNTGDTIDIKRPTSYVPVRTATGDITGQKGSIITGKASATVQDYITVALDYDEAAEALEMGTDMSRYWEDAASDIITTLETDVAHFMMENAGLLSGDGETAVSDWKDVADAGALMKSVGIAPGPWYYAMNPYTESTLSDKIVSMAAGGSAGNTINQTLDTATLKSKYAGFDRVMSTPSLSSYSRSAVADRAGALAADPNVAYLAHKDTMIQTLSVKNFGNNLVIKAGEKIQFATAHALNLKTRKPIIDASGSRVLYTATVAEDVTLSGTGTGTITVTGPAIFEAGGAYNSVDAAPVTDDAITLLGTASATVQPNLFWHRDAFSIASVKIHKLHSTDTLAMTKDGLQLRVSKYANGDANSQTVRIDLRPAYGVMNPYMAGHGFGN